VEAPALVKTAKIASDTQTDTGVRVLAGKVEGRAVELVLELDGRILRGKCTCSHHYQFGLRRGPCRHLQALRMAAEGGRKKLSLAQWFGQLWQHPN
jgi:hypothetical protein